MAVVMVAAHRSVRYENAARRDVLKGVGNAMNSLVGRGIGIIRSNKKEIKTYLFVNCNK